MPPFAPNNGTPASDTETKDGSSGRADAPYEPLGDGSPAQNEPAASTNGEGPAFSLGEVSSDSGDESLPDDPLAELEAEIDAELVDEAASRMSSSTSVGTNDRVVEMLLRRGVVDTEQVEAAQERRDAERALWRVLAEEEGVDEDAVYERAARIYAFAVTDLEEQEADLDFVTSTVESFSEEQQNRLLDLGLVPHHVEKREQGRGKKVIFVTHDPMRPEVHRIARSLDVDQFELQYAPKGAVNELLADAFPKDNEYLERIDEESALDLGQSFEADEEDLVDEEKLEEEINRSTLINLFEATLVEAVREGASDIHIYPNPEKEVEIHFRIDGRLTHWHTEDRVHPEALLSVIKDNSQ
ncbi:MAG: type II/IV secretion system protein, partial [Salinibacter sp.]